MSPLSLDFPAAPIKTVLAAAARVATVARKAAIKPTRTAKRTNDLADDGFEYGWDDRAYIEAHIGHGFHA